MLASSQILLGGIVAARPRYASPSPASRRPQAVRAHSAADPERAPAVTCFAEGPDHLALPARSAPAMNGCAPRREPPPSRSSRSWPRHAPQLAAPGLLGAPDPAYLYRSEPQVVRCGACGPWLSDLGDAWVCSLSPDSCRALRAGGWVKGRAAPAEKSPIARARSRRAGPARDRGWRGRERAGLLCRGRGCASASESTDRRGGRSDHPNQASADHPGLDRRGKRAFSGSRRRGRSPRCERARGCSGDVFHRGGDWLWLGHHLGPAVERAVHERGVTPGGQKLLPGGLT
jgi:hypothetical protein